MKFTTSVFVAIVGLAACSWSDAALPLGLSQTPAWKHVTRFPGAKAPRGKVTSTGDGTILTLPDGRKFVSKVSDEKTTLIFPNRQVFSAETAKGGFEPPYVSEDLSLVASVVIPSTQSGELHLFLVGQNGKYREVQGVNGKIGQLLEKAGAPFGADALRILDLKEGVLSLGSVDYGTHRGEVDLFTVRVASDGTISLGE